MADKNSSDSDAVKIHWKSAVPAFILGAVLNYAGVVALSPYIPYFAEVMKKHQQEICGEIVTKLSLDYLKKTNEIEKRVAVLETVLKINGIEIPVDKDGN